MKYRNLQVILVTAISMFLYLGMRETLSASGWYNANYLNRKQITITGTTAGAQTNYPMKLTVNRTTGTDGSGVVYVSTNCLSSYLDIRFTKSDGTTPLNFWMETIIGTSAVFWIDFDAIPGWPGTANFFIYYNYPGESATTSSGTNTFDWFDDFSGGSINAIYSRIGYNGWTQAGGVLTFTTAGTTYSDPNVLIINNKTYGYGYEIRGKVQVRTLPANDGSRMGYGLLTDASGLGYKGLFHYNITLATTTQAILHDLIAWFSESATTWSLSTWYNFAFFTKNSTTGSPNLFEKSWLSTIAEPVGYTTTVSNYTGNQGMQPCIAGATIPLGGLLPTQFTGDYDDVFVRKCSDTEPAWGSWGTPVTQMVLTPSKTDASCNLKPDGTANVSITGGTAPYTYLWNTVPNQTTQPASGLTAGTYNVMVTDNSGLTANTSVTILQPDPLAVSITTPTISCYGGSNGTMTVIASGGTGPTYNFSNDNGVTWTGLTTNPHQFTGLNAYTTYKVRISDGNGCVLPVIP